MIDLGQGGHRDLGDEVPLAVGGVQAGDRGQSAQRHDGRIGVVALDRQVADRADGGVIGVVGHDDGEALDDAAAHQPLDALGHRGARGVQLPRQLGHRLAGVLAQGRDEPPVEIVKYI